MVSGQQSPHPMAPTSSLPMLPYDPPDHLLFPQIQPLDLSQRAVESSLPCPARHSQPLPPESPQQTLYGEIIKGQSTQDPAHICPPTQRHTTFGMKDKTINNIIDSTEYSEKEKNTQEQINRDFADNNVHNPTDNKIATHNVCKVNTTIEQTKESCIKRNRQRASAKGKIKKSKYTANSNQHSQDEAFQNPVSKKILYQNSDIFMVDKTIGPKKTRQGYFEKQ